MKDDLEKRRLRISRIVTVTAVGVTAFVVAPFVYIAIQGMVGLAAAAGIGLAGVTVAPVIADKFANWKLKALKAEAAKNPIETMQLSLINDHEMLAKAREGLKAFAGQVKGFERNVHETIARYPQDAAMLKEQLDNMQLLLGKRTERYRTAAAELAKKEEAVNRAAHMWKMSQAAQSIFKQGGAGEDVLAKIKLDTAFDAVNESADRAFAEIDSEILELGARAQLAHERAEVIENEVTIPAEYVRRGES